MSSDNQEKYKTIYDVCPNLLKDDPKFYFYESSEEDFEKDKLVFQDELQRLANKYDLGSISFGESWDGSFIPDRIFYINTLGNARMLDREYGDKIIELMKDFSIENGLFDFFKEVYIMFK